MKPTPPDLPPFMRVVVYESTKAADCEVSLKRVALIEDLILHKMVCGIVREGEGRGESDQLVRSRVE